MSKIVERSTKSQRIRFYIIIIIRYARVTFYFTNLERSIYIIANYSWILGCPPLLLLLTDLHLVKDKV